jgi:hypothetical protein
LEVQVEHSLLKGGCLPVSIYEHFFWNFAIFYRKSWAWKVGVGGTLPDLLYIVPFLPRMLTYQSFMEWMYDPLWDRIWNSTVAKSAHSAVIWGAVALLLLLILEKGNLKRFFPFLLGWGLHIIFDALTHVSDGYALFFPLSDYRFPAPVSYWEREFYAREYFWISHSLMAALFIYWVASKLKRPPQERNERS